MAATPFDPRTLTDKHQVLWLHQGEVEMGHVLFLTNSGVEVVWLEGYKSRNDAPAFDEILAVFDKDGEQHKLGAFSGTGWLTVAGEQFIATQTQNMTATSETVVADRPEIDLLDVLKDRVIAGQPIYVVGNPPGAVSEALDAAHKKIAEEVRAERTT